MRTPEPVVRPHEQGAADVVRPQPLRPLWLYAEADVDLEPIKAAKAALDLPFRVKPVDVTEHDRGVRVLAVGAKPGWLADFYLVAERDSPERLQAALAWVLGDGDDPDATTVGDTICAIFGEGTREITPEELASERAWAAYFEEF